MQINHFLIPPEMNWWRRVEQRPRVQLILEIKTKARHGRMSEQGLQCPQPGEPHNPRVHRDWGWGQTGGSES